LAAHFTKISSEDPVFLQTRTGKAIKNQKKLEKSDTETPIGEALHETPSFFEQAMEGAGPSDDARAMKRIEFLIFCLSPPSNRNRYPRTNLCWCLEVPMMEAGEDKRENGENVSDKANKEEENEKERDKHLKSAKDEFSPYKIELAYLK
jgi:hypothetical protein